MKTITIELPEHLAEKLLGPWFLISAEHARHIREHIRQALPNTPKTNANPTPKTNKTSRKTR